MFGSNSPQHIGFIGTGVMGNAMAGHLIAAGYRLSIYNRTRARCENLLGGTACWYESPAKIAEQKPDLIITMLGYPQDVEEVYAELLENCDEQTVCIDMTTSSPKLAQRIALQASERGIKVLDAPVSGGDLGAKNATLTIMVGGEEDAFEYAKPVFEVMGKTITLHGMHGAGQHCKMANQINIAATMLGMCEALAYAKAALLDPEKVIATLSGGSAQTWSLANYGPRILKGDFQPGFYIKHFIKDLGIALDEAEQFDIQLPGTKLARELYEKLADQGYTELGTQALAILYNLNKGI